MNLSPTSAAPAIAILRRPLWAALVLAIATAGAFTAPPSAAASASTEWELPGGWTATRGGENGHVIEVRTLAASGAGSLAEALATSGPRVIVFRIGGVLDLGGQTLLIREPQVTIAGETAPSPGITLTGGGVSIATHDVVVRHLRIRPGAGTRPRRSGWEVDGLCTAGGAHDVVVDHCSISWATDENLSASGPRFRGETPREWRQNTSHRVTFSHCIVGEALHNSSHAKGPHSMGSLVHDNTSEIAIVGNLYISNNARNPLFKGGARGAVINNLIHNPGTRVVAFGLVAKEWEGHAWERGALVIAGNIAQKGMSSAPDLAFFEVVGPCDAYLADNLFFDRRGQALPSTTVFRSSWDASRVTRTDPTGSYCALASTPFWPPRLEARPADATKAWVLANAGARPWNRDAIDRRLVEEAATGGGKIIDYESEVGAAASR